MANAANRSANNSAVKQQDDVALCSVCSEILTDPRSLPCFHPFCLKCIEGHSTDKQPGDKVPCPTCHKEFTVPDGGIKELPINVFVEKLVHIKYVLHIQDTHSPCDSCEAATNDEDEIRRKAVVYCVECQGKLCESCADAHKKLKILRPHKLIRLDDSKGLEAELSLRSAAPSACDKHKDQMLSVFCDDCKTTICVVCYIASHKQHTCSDVNDVIDKFRHQMTTDVNGLVDGVGKLQEMSASIEQQKENFLKQVAETEEEIIKKADELKQLIEQNKQTLLGEMATKKVNITKHLDKLNLEIIQQIRVIEKLKKYSEELSDKGASSDIVRETNSLHERVEELLKIDVIERSRYDMDCVLVKFTASSQITKDGENVVGKIDLEDTNPDKPTLIHTRPSTGHSVVGVTSMNDQLFISCYNNSQIQVYDSKTYTLQRSIAVPGLSLAYGITSCPVNKCLYISGHNTNNIFRVELSGITTNWPAGAGPAGLSINQATNVIVAGNGSNKLLEYTTRGDPVREINLQPAGITSPWHALQFADDLFVVSSQTHRVCVVNAGGQVVHTYGSTTAGAGAGQLNNPAGLVLLRNGSIVVADRNNNRIMLLDKSLNSANLLTLPADCALQTPFALYLDESRGRLYVGEFNGARMLVLDNIVSRALTYKAVFNID